MNNFLKVSDFVNKGLLIIDGQQFSLLGDLPPLGSLPQEGANKFSSHVNLQNKDLDQEDDNSAEGYNYSLVQMDDFLQDQGLFGKDSTDLVNTYYQNLAMMGQPQKPCYYPPPDLGMIESMGSMENSSKHPTTLHSQKSNKLEGIEKSESMNSVKSKASQKSKNSEEQPLEDWKSYSSSQNSISGMKGGSVQDIETIPGSAKSNAKSDKSKDKDENNSFSQESYYILEDITKEGLQSFLKNAMQVFDERYSIEKKEIEDDIEVMPPTYDLMYKYCKYVVIASKMEKEIPILALVYLERLLARTGILMNNLNWRRLILTVLCLASKIWDDDSLENEHFPKVMKDVTIQEINTFERILLDLIGYDLVIKGPEYAKYYFILRTIAQTHKIPMPLQPLSVEKILKLQQTSNDAELNLRDQNKPMVSVTHSM